MSAGNVKPFASKLFGGVSNFYHFAPKDSAPAKPDAPKPVFADNKFTTNPNDSERLQNIEKKRVAGHAEFLPPNFRRA